MLDWTNVTLISRQCQIANWQKCQNVPDRPRWRPEWPSLRHRHVRPDVEGLLDRPANDALTRPWLEMFRVEPPSIAKSDDPVGDQRITQVEHYKLFPIVVD
jgi:hypothetical protein